MKKYKVEYYPYGFTYATSYYVEAENEEQAAKIAALQERVKPEDFKAKNFVVKSSDILALTMVKYFSSPAE